MNVGRTDFVLSVCLLSFRLCATLPCLIDALL